VAWEELIVSGLKGLAGRTPIGGAGAGQGRNDGGNADRIARLCITAVVRVRRALRRLRTWAAGRSISPNSLSGISLLLALCAAAWFSGHAGQDGARGALAMIGWLAALSAARWLAVFVVRPPAAEPGSAKRANAGLAAAAGQEAAFRFAWSRSVSAAGAECAIYGGMAAGSEAAGFVAIWPLAVGTIIAVATADLLGACLRAALAAAPGERSKRVAAVLRWTGRFLTLPAGVRGSIALLGFAIVGADGAFFAVLAVSVSSIAVTVAMLGKITPAGHGPAGRTRAATQSPDSARRRSIWAHSAKTGRVPPRAQQGPTPSPAAMSGITIIGGPASAGIGAAQVTSAGGRGERVSETTGPHRAAYPAGVDGSAESRGLARAREPAGSRDAGRVRGTARPEPMTHASGVTSVGGPRGGQISPDVAGAGGDLGARGAGNRGDVAGATDLGVAGLTRPAGEAAKTNEASAGGASAEGLSADRADPRDASPKAAKASTPSGQADIRAAARDVLLALRDDGSAARWAGRLVQGNLIPLPPALAGLVATSLLAILGVRNLAGFIVLTPPVVMMLAAPGSSHPHDRRFDWLVPVLLALAQYVYLAPLGFALGLPGPAVFSACALLFIWYTSVIATAASGSGRGASMGWEARMFTIGLATTFGLATFGYVGLATYVGVLICRKVMTGYLVPGEEDRQ